MKEPTTFISGAPFLARREFFSGALEKRFIYKKILGYPISTNFFVALRELFSPRHKKKTKFFFLKYLKNINTYLIFIMKNII